MAAKSIVQPEGATTRGVRREEGRADATNGSGGPRELRITVPVETDVNQEHSFVSREADVDQDAGGKRRMPDNLRRYLIKMQGGKMYLPAAYRIVWFRDELGDNWGIRTELVEGGHEAGFATVHAEVLNPDGRVIASGHKTEAKSDFPAGWVEKAESGAVARALALMGFGTQFTPELDDDGYRPADSPQPRHVYAPQRSARAEPRIVMESSPLSGGERQAGSAASNGVTAGEAAAPEHTVAPTAIQEIWEGPGQCTLCHAPEGKRHGRQCLG